MFINGIRVNEDNDIPFGEHAMFSMIAVIMGITGFTLPGSILNQMIAMASKGVVAMGSRGKTLTIVLQRSE